jgi:hypothetical protein
VTAPPETPHDRHPNLARLLTPSLVALALANLWPLVGVVFLGWTTFSVLLLFWLENVIVGCFNVGRMWMAGDDEGGKWAVIPFFIVHYGMFTAIHGMFVIAIFAGDLGDSWFTPTLVRQMVADSGIGPAALALAASHGYSFVVNYLRGGEFRTATLRTLMAQPYTRVVVLHMTIIFGGFLIVSLGQPVAALALLIVLKVVIDGAAHLRERGRLRPTGSAQATRPIGPSRRPSGRAPGRR